MVRGSARRRQPVAVIAAAWLAGWVGLTRAQAWNLPVGRRASLAAAVGVFGLPVSALAGTGDGKRRNLDASEVAKIVRDDLVARQFLATADFSPEIYDEACTFTDEIDTYQKDKFIKGTKALFVASESNVQLVGDVDILEGGKKLQFRFQESLAFNFPIVHPKVTLSGTCTLTRGEDGLIVALQGEMGPVNTRSAAVGKDMKC
eukprot:CAMPEP_0181472016 /NCGR_PEP_ID=MMETSP1110-20121109/39378_1 /TAXON_ID=174948 /ORGANISM="Symbiodinium sp., Strain CCMP421" /LENGTH=202 /DNA_ID=CAMNT_0023597063 /DNA_START=47 /DNA_END=651 /DNA_ORIENTATION=-